MGDPKYVAAYLREHDRDRYFATLVIPEAHRPAVQALYAFNADVAGIAARVRDPAAGEVRLQWWHDALTGQGHGNICGNPLADALLEATASNALPPGPLLGLLEARRFDLYTDPMPDLVAFEGYAGETVSILHQVAAMVLNGGVEPPSGDAAGHLGVAHGLLGHLRAFGYHASRGRIFLPWSILAAAGVNEQEVLSGTMSEGLTVALGDLHEGATTHLDKAATAIAALPRNLRPAFAQIAVLRGELRGAQKHIETPFAAPADMADWRKIAALAWWTWRNA